MKRVATLIVATVSVTASCASAQLALPSTVYDWTMGTADQNSMMASVAGIVNRNTHGELLLSTNDPTQPHALFWLKELQRAYPQVQSEFHSTPMFFINRYKSYFSGYVLYDPVANPESLNLATSIAGVTNAIIVDAATLSYATAAGLPKIADARAMTADQVYQQYRSQFNPNLYFNQDPARSYQLRDYAIMNKGFMAYEPPNMDTYLANQNKQGQVFGFGPAEKALFTRASVNNQQVTPSDYSGGNSATAKWEVPISKQKYHAPARPTVQPAKHYVAFVMSDGDNEQWLTNNFATDAKWFGSPHRGEFDMTWDMTSTLAKMNPVAMNYLYQQASNGAHHDDFVSPSGQGIVFPSLAPDTAGLALSINQSLHLADQGVVSVLDTPSTLLTADLSELSPILAGSQVKGMMYKTYNNGYRDKNGTVIRWVDGKPIMSVKYSLWDAKDSARSIADGLNADPHRDALTDQLSYTIVNVNPWSVLGPDGTGAGDPMSNLSQLVRWLDPTAVNVITLDEMMNDLRNNFGRPIETYPASYALGDANFDGAVNFDDLVIVAQHYDQANAGLLMSVADFNLDGFTNFADLVTLAQNYNTTPSGLAALTNASFAQDWVLAQSLAPEPTSVAAAGAASIALLRRSRRVATI